jgi:hypothetical protein
MRRDFYFSIPTSDHFLPQNLTIEIDIHLMALRIDINGRILFSSTFQKKIVNSSVQIG